MRELEKEAQMRSKLVPVETTEETGWVIVRDLPTQLGYWDGVHFDIDNLKAIRFARQLDADRYLRLMHGGSEHPDRVEEHLWPAAAPEVADAPAFEEDVIGYRWTMEVTK